MAKLYRKVSKDAQGLPPGTPVFSGEKRQEQGRISVCEFDEARCHEQDITDGKDFQIFKDDPAVTWINVKGVEHVDLVMRMGETFNLHPLVLEDILNTDQRPKLEDYEDYLYIVFKHVTFNSDQSDFVYEQISLILGKDFIISFIETDNDVIQQLLSRIRAARGRIRRMGPDYLAYCIMDLVVDNYFVILETTGERLETLEEKLLDANVNYSPREIQKLKRRLLIMRRSIYPMREVVVKLERRDTDLIKADTEYFFRDLYDHTIQVADTLETFRDMLSGLMEIYLSSMSNRLNVVMKTLTVITTIFMPLSFIAGVYGMNFENMPELKSPFGYPAVIAVMIAISGGMILYFRKKGWL